MPKRILIIEDNQDLRENLSEILQLSGYETTEASNGKEGVEYAMQQTPDLILCDVMMPILDGFGVLKILNNNEKLMHVPFMFLTAKSEKTDFRKGMGLGADDYITKPFDDVELLDAIEIRLKKSEKLSSLKNTDLGLKHFFSEAKGQKDLDKLSENREIRKYSKKELIYDEGQYPNWLFFVISGQVKCFQINDFGKELTTHIYGPGDFFGFIPLLMDNRYEDNAISLESCELRLIPPDDFKLLLYNNRDFAAKFIKMLAHHADHNERQLLELAYSSVRKKVANALLLLKEKVGSDTFNIMREDLASLAGTAKETVIRTLSDFKSEGIIDIQKSDLKIIDHTALIEMPQ